MKARALASAVVLAALALVVAAPGAAASTGGGRIVFARATCTQTCSWTIVAADPNDTNETVLAGPYPRDAFDDHLIANWSPDGSKVAFMAYQGIWVVNADGSGLHQVFQPPAGTGVDDGPDYTPDGKHIVFTRCCPDGYGYSLWSIDSDGGGLKDVTKEPSVNGDGPADTTPQVAPDGKRIAFNRCLPAGSCEIATVSMAGGGLRELTDPTQMDTEHPNWSPDSKTIVFNFDQNEGPANIATVGADGGGLTQLTFNTRSRSGSFDPGYSPDGSRILFVQFPSTGATDLFTMGTDGGGIAQVTKTVPAEFAPQWVE